MPTFVDPIHLGATTPVQNRVRLLRDVAQAVAETRPRRIAAGIPLARDEARTWYSQRPAGYVDYPIAS